MPRDMPETSADSLAENAAECVLIVDDLPQNIGVVYGFLRAEGYQVLVAQSGEQALEIAASTPLDLVLLDVVMPGLGGLETCRRLKARETTREVPVIFLTALSELKDKLEGFQAGAVDYVSKPVQKEELLARVRTHLHLRRLRRQLAERNRLLQAEIERQKAAEAGLRLADSVFNAVGEAIMVTDENNRIVAVNPAFTRITGYAPEDVLGRDPSIMKSGRHEAAFYAAMWRELRENGCWQGEIWNRHKRGEIIAELLSISTVDSPETGARRHVAIFHDITERKRAEMLLDHKANFDLLTDLPNRALFFDRLRQAMQMSRRDQTPLALMFVDLDGFKAVNDSLGHAAGDELLRVMAARLQTCVRASDTVARLGGDEFAIILPNLAPGVDAARVAEMVVAQLALPVVLRGRESGLSGSIGIVIFPDGDDDATSADELLSRADYAMYQAKQAGRNTYRYFDAARPNAREYTKANTKENA